MQIWTGTPSISCSYGQALIHFSHNNHNRTVENKNDLTALSEAKNSILATLIKYSLFSPLGLATLYGILRDADEMELQALSWRSSNTGDTPDTSRLLSQVYILPMHFCAYAIARSLHRLKGCYVCLGGLRIVSLFPRKPCTHDSIFI